MLYQISNGFLGVSLGRFSKEILNKYHKIFLRNIVKKKLEEIPEEITNAILGRFFFKIREDKPLQKIFEKFL